MSSVVINTTKNYTAAITGSSPTYSWSLSGGGSIQGGQNTSSITVFWTTTGTFTVNCTATNGCSTLSNTFSVTVTDNCVSITSVTITES